jgi:predicted RNase H-like HicB family nuclease
MRRSLQLTAVIKKVEDGYSALCPQFDLTGKGNSADEAFQNLHQVVKDFIDTATPDQVESRMQLEVYVSRLEIETN